MNSSYRKDLSPDRLKRAEIFDDTLEQIKNVPQIHNIATTSKNMSQIYVSDVFILPPNPHKKPNYIINNRRTVEAAKEFDNVVVLNFASATSVGGGVKRGSAAQEEAICRISTLYTAIDKEDFKDTYYNYHRNQKGTMYSNRMIYTPNALVFKKDIDYPTLLPEKDWYKISVITAPAPNLREVIKVNQNEILNIFKERIRKILSIAIENKHTNIVLGAFGCGAFKNDPAIVSRAFREILINEDYQGYFDNIAFAIYTKDTKTDRNYTTFKNALNLK